MYTITKNKAAGHRPERKHTMTKTAFEPYNATAKTEGAWTQGSLLINGKVLKYWVKHFDEPSEWGIMQGRVSKLEIRPDGEAATVSYDRGWDRKAEDEESKVALGYLLRKYN